MYVCRLWQSMELQISTEFIENTIHFRDKHTFFEWHKDKALEYPFSPFCAIHLHPLRVPSSDLQFILILNNYHQGALFTSTWQ